MSSILSSDWFLPQGETRLESFTSGNRVLALIDGESFMSRLHDDLSALTGAGYLHIVGWRMTPRARLRGNTPGATPIRMDLRGLLWRGTKVRSMLWFLPLTNNDFGIIHGGENLSISALINNMGGEAILDDRLPGGTFASHHQKFIVLGEGSYHAAYIGGIDIALDRWDTPKHSGSSNRQREFFDAWHDVQARIEGPAVGQLWEAFAERWNDPRVTHSASLDTIGNNAPAPITEGRPSQSATGTCDVQVLFTYPCQTRVHGPGDSHFYPFAPQGDFSYEKALRRAIAQAEYYVYIEDQYFWPCAVVDELVNAANRGVTIILVLADKYDVPGLVPFHNFLRSQSLEKLTESNNVFVYSLVQQDQFGGNDIYVHSKTVIIDDRYAVIGTANINRRSMRTDTEIGVAIVDTATSSARVRGGLFEVCNFAHWYRMELWKEHLGFAPQDPLNPDGSPSGFPVATGDRVHHVKHHVVPHPRFCEPSIIPFVFMNPTTPCDDSDGGGR